MSDVEHNEGGSDEEYEIEQVLDCDYERFEPERWAYLVSWKGYGPEDNSWVREEDAENAAEMLQEFWDRNAEKRRTVEAAIAAKKQKLATSKKRGRASAGRGASTDRDVKKARQSSSVRDGASASRGRAVSDDEDGGVEEVIEDEETQRKKRQEVVKRRLANVGDWDSLVERVDTVEKNETGIVVFLTFNSGEQLAYPSEVCRTRCPQALIRFYEQHLRFRPSAESAAATQAPSSVTKGDPDH